MISQPAVAEASGHPALEGLRPRLQPGVLISAAAWHGARRVHLVREPHAGRTFEVGPREAFVMSRLDGSTTLQQVGEDYLREFGRRLDDRAFGQLLGLLSGRRLLATDAAVPTDAPVPTDATAPTASADSARPRNSLLRGELHLVADPQSLTHRLRTALPVPGGRGRIPAVVLGVLAAVACVVCVVTAGAQIGSAVRSPLAVVLAVLLVWATTALHELAHGVVAARAGGTVTAYGIRWRAGLFIPFCRVDDFAFLPARGQRVAAALIGPWVHLVVGGLAAGCWLAGLRTGAVGDVVLLIAVANLALAIGNLIPLAPLDGYAALSHAAGVLQLTTQSQAYVASRVRRAIGAEQDARSDRYPRGVRALYLGYAVLAPVLVLALAALIVIGVAALLPDAAGPWRYAGPAAGVIFVIVGLATAQRTRTEQS